MARPSATTVSSRKAAAFCEGLVRVPLIFSCPARIRAGVRSDALVELMDIAPPLLALAGIAVPEAMQAKSLSRILDSRAPADRHRDFARSEYYDALDLP